MAEAMLAGIRVLEMASVISGPYAGMLLADLGAEVVKVEAPGSGDPFRSWAGGADAISPAFAAYNRGKRSVTIDIKTAEGRAAYLALADTADAVIENMRPGKADELGIGWQKLGARNPGLVYCAVSGMGQVGPERDRPAYDAVAQAMGGLWSQLTDMADPAPVGPPISDQLTGLFAAYGILGALMARQRTGEGRCLDVSMFGATVAFQPHAVAEYLNAGRVADAGFRARISQSYAFVCADGRPIAVHLSSPPKFWTALVELVGRHDLATDPRFATKPDREINYDALQAELATVFATETRAVWLERLIARDIPCAPLNTVAEALAEPQADAMGMTAVFGRDGRAMPLVGSAVRDPMAPDVAADRPVPRLGEHTDDILTALGVGAAG
jgi:formyl-CoA transferase